MAGRKKKEQLDTATPQPSSKLDGHVHFDRNNDEISDEIFEAVESDSAELSESYLKQLHVDELLEILDFIDEDEEKDKYETVQRILHSKKVEPIEIARIDERAWSYFYDKYILRIALLIWAVFGFTALKGMVSGTIETAPGKTLAISNIVTLAGVGVLILIWRLIFAWLESKPGKPARGTGVVRRKLGLRIVNQEGKSPSAVICFLRGLLKAFPLGFITLLTIEMSKKNRGMHDMLFKTYVVRVNSENVQEEDIARFIQTNF